MINSYICEGLEVRVWSMYDGIPPAGRCVRYTVVVESGRVGVAVWRCGGVAECSDGRTVLLLIDTVVGLGVVVSMEGVYARGEGWRVRVLHVSVRVRAHRSLCLFVCVANSKAATDLYIRHRFYFVSVSV